MKLAQHITAVRVVLASLLAACILMGFGAVARSSSLSIATIPEPAATPLQQSCTPATITQLPDAGCARPLTGCICTTSGSGTASSLADCEGCTFTFSGNTHCTYSVGPPTDTPFSCNLGTDCNGSATCGGLCPCTGGSYRPIQFDCGPCN